MEGFEESLPKSSITAMSMVEQLSVRITRSELKSAPNVIGKDANTATTIRRRQRPSEPQDSPRFSFKRLNKTPMEIEISFLDRERLPC